MIRTQHQKNTKPTAGNLPEVTLAVAEKVLRDVARRNGHIIRKRRSPSRKEVYGDGYAIIDCERNWLLSGATTSDGCDLSLAGLAEWYQEDKHNTSWQRIVIQAILADNVATATEAGER